jgi:hypothetical protein
MWSFPAIAIDRRTGGDGCRREDSRFRVASWPIAELRHLAALISAYNTRNTPDQTAFPFEKLESTRFELRGAVGSAVRRG